MDTAVVDNEVAEKNTLADYADILQQHHNEMQTCSKAYGRLRDMCHALEQLQNDSSIPVELPRITISWSQENENVVPFEFDMNLVKTFPDYLAVFAPVFQVIADAAANTLMTSWGHIGQISDSARSIINDAQAKQNASNGN